MAVAKIIEIISGSSVSFDDAVKQGLAKAAETVNGITSAWVKDQNVVVDGGRITEYRVVMKLTFMLGGDSQPAKAGKMGKKK